MVSIVQTSIASTQHGGTSGASYAVVRFFTHPQNHAYEVHFTILLIMVSLLPARALSLCPHAYLLQKRTPYNPVLLGVVTLHYIAGAYLMDAQVLEWIKPLGIPSNNIIIISGNGGDCRHGTGNFAIGDTLISAPDQDNPPYINTAHRQSFGHLAERRPSRRTLCQTLENRAPVPSSENQRVGDAWYAKTYRFATT